MIPTLPVLQIIVYGFAFWFGTYLLARHFNKPGMRYTGFGLSAYGLGLGIDVLLNKVTSPENDALLRQERAVIVILPLVFWFASVRYLFPAHVRAALPKVPLRVVLVGSIFFVLSVSLALLPQPIFASDLVVLAVGLDLVALSYGIAVLDAYEEGETLPRDAMRSLGASGLAALIFGGQVILAMTIAGRDDAGMLFLLLAITATAIALQTFSDPLQTLLDKILLAGQPKLQNERARLRGVATALVRIDETLDASHLSDQEFTRLTRRALGHMGDLRRLASSPLARLPLIGTRLSARGQPDNTLERAAELRAVLAESIERLKPRGEDFGTTDEWRYYNALYFVYVLGLKPYSRDVFSQPVDSAPRAALEWFRAQVPERTLHNWQNSAAELVARDLQEQNNKSDLP
jgi:hypothetical protein